MIWQLMLEYLDGLSIYTYTCTSSARASYWNVQKNSYNSLINVSFFQRKKDGWEKNLYICVVLRAKILATASKSIIKWRLLRGRRQTWGVDSTKGVIFRLVFTIKRLFEWLCVKKLVAFICRMCANVNKKQVKSISNFTVC